MGYSRFKQKNFPFLRLAFSVVRNAPSALHLLILYRAAKRLRLNQMKDSMNSVFV
jgi:hypothetical protein